MLSVLKRVMYNRTLHTHTTIDMLSVLKRVMYNRTLYTHYYRYVECTL